MSFSFFVMCVISIIFRFTETVITRLVIRIRTILYKNNEAQICPKSKNKLRTIEARLQMKMYQEVFIEKHNTMLQDNHENFLRKTVF